MSIKILFLGDIVGKIGRRTVAKVLPELKKELEPDLIIANGENLAHGKGITRSTIEEALEAGVDFLTSGNHMPKKEEGLSLYQDKNLPLIRPANYPPGVPGQGYKIIEVATKKILIINLVGRAFFREHFDCPFRKFDEIFEETKEEKIAARVVDFHAEATSEKNAFAWYADGRASLILGSHTHVPTADLRILPQGTGYISDVGMVGAKDSVIGLKKEEIIKWMLWQIPQIFEIPTGGKATLNAVAAEIDLDEGRVIKIERVVRETEV